MKKKDIASMNVNDLKNKIEEINKDIMKRNAQKGSGNSQNNPGQIRQLKKTIARINTRLRTSEVEKAK